MARMEFEYDEEGGTFFYFFLSFWSLLLFPFTIYYYKSSKTKHESEDRIRRQCNCELCIEKRKRSEIKRKWERPKKIAILIGLCIGWMIWFALAYKVSKIQLEYIEYDPYIELGIDRGASQAEIRKAYRSMSLKYHPDKEGGDQKSFIKIAKAYAALTDEETRKNWEEFGDPDGSGVKKHGIALPKWIVEKGNSQLVLLVYALAFIIILPMVVGKWWYNSIKFSKDQVLLETTDWYFYSIRRCPNMILERVVMVLAASMEFSKFYNKEIVERPSDNEEIPQLMRKLKIVCKKNEKLFSCPYCVKTRALLQAHFTRFDLSPELEVDKRYVLSKSSCLINEMINTIPCLVAISKVDAKKCPMPKLDTVENCIKLSQMLMQGQKEKASPFLQLPHITQDMLKHFVTKKRKLRRIEDLVKMKHVERRALLRKLGAEEYKNVLNVCASMPYVNMEVKSEVLDEVDSSITAGCTVTVTVKLTRHNMEVMFDEPDLDLSHLEDAQMEYNKDSADDAQNTTAAVIDSQACKQPQKSCGNRKGKQKKKCNIKKTLKQAYDWKLAATIRTKDVKAKQSKEKMENERIETDEGVVNDFDTENAVSIQQSNDSSESEDDEEQWNKYKEEAKKETRLEAKIKESYPAHCPYFPEEKQEGWWLYVADKINNLLMTAPVHILTLKTSEEIKLMFRSPETPGVYKYHVNLKSDCYFDFDQSQKINLDVKEAKVILDNSDDEDDMEDDGSDSDYTTDTADSDGV